MVYLIFKVVKGIMNKIPLVTLMNKDTHYWSIDKPYECELDTLERGFLQKGLGLFYANQKSYYCHSPTTTTTTPPTKQQNNHNFVGLRLSNHWEYHHHPQVKNYPKIKSNSNVRIEGNMEN